MFTKARPGTEVRIHAGDHAGERGIVLSHADSLTPKTQRLTKGMVPVLLQYAGSFHSIEITYVDPDYLSSGSTLA